MCCVDIKGQALAPLSETSHYLSKMKSEVSSSAAVACWDRNDAKSAAIVRILI